VGGEAVGAHHLPGGAGADRARVFRSVPVPHREGGFPRVPHCEEDQDTAQHTLEACPAWEVQRRALISVTGEDHSLAAVVREMVRDEKAWRAVTAFCEDVMAAKEEAERKRRDRRRIPPHRWREVRTGDFCEGGGGCLGLRRQRGTTSEEEEVGLGGLLKASPTVSDLKGGAGGGSTGHVVSSFPPRCPLPPSVRRGPATRGRGTGRGPVAGGRGEWGEPVRAGYLPRHTPPLAEPGGRRVSNLTVVMV